jgi:hypothetical protein
MKRTIKPKERETIIRSLQSGVVPRIGLQHFHVGRNEELASFVHDIDTISNGGTSFRLVIGEYGSGKTFFLSLIRNIALEKGLVTINADLSPQKRLYGTGLVRSLLSELIASFSTRTKKDGNALPNILEKFISIAQEISVETGRTVGTIINEMLEDLKEYPTGYTFAKVIGIYWKAYESGNDILLNNALKWLKAEYSAKLDAIRELGVRDILNDNSFFDTIKLYSILVRKAGYKGLFVCLDEMVNLYKISHSVSRKANYEEILCILNNTLQGTLSNIGFVMSGTPEFLTDTSRGLYSYEALRSRLAENKFSKNLGVIDYNSTVMRLSNLTQEELYLLLINLRNVYAYGEKEKYLIPDEAIIAYLSHCMNKIGESYFRTPRNTIKGFLDLLSILDQYKDKKWTDIIEEIYIEEDIEISSLGSILEQNTFDMEEFASLKL